MVLPVACAESFLMKWHEQGHVTDMGSLAQVPRQLSPGQASGQIGDAAVAGTSSFGMSGINAHMLLSAGGLKLQVRQYTRTNTALVLYPHMLQSNILKCFRPIEFIWRAMSRH